MLFKTKSTEGLSEEEVSRNDTLGKLGCFKSTVKKFLVYVASISLASRAILSLTSWYAVDLHARPIYSCKVAVVNASKNHK